MSDPEVRAHVYLHTASRRPWFNSSNGEVASVNFGNAVLHFYDPTKMRQAATILLEAADELEQQQQDRGVA
jgi:hypothetical protein